MNPQKEQEIISTLRRNDHRAIPFVQTKKELLDKGFSEAEIVYCLYSAPYDGKPNPRPAHPLEKFYKKHPVLAQRVAHNILKDIERKRRTQTLLLTAASMFAPGRHASLHYAAKAADSAGVPYMTILFISIGLVLATIYLNWPPLIAKSAMVVMSCYIIYKIWRLNR